MESMPSSDVLSAKLNFLDKQREKLHKTLDTYVDQVLRSGWKWIENNDEGRTSFLEISQLVEYCIVFILLKLGEISETHLYSRNVHKVQDEPGPRNRNAENCSGARPNLTHQADIDQLIRLVDSIGTSSNSVEVSKNEDITTERYLSDCQGFSCNKSSPDEAETMSSQDTNEHFSRSTEDEGVNQLFLDLEKSPQQNKDIPENNLCMHEKEPLERKQNMNEVASHINLESFDCHICFEKFESESHFNRHFQEKHKFQTLYKCQRCGIVYTTRYNLNRHQNSCHSSESNLKRHKYKRQLKCQHCEKVYTRPYSLRRHQKIHLKNTCNVCNLTFGSEISLKRHMLEHPVVRQDKSDLGTVGFSTSELTQHKQIDTGEKKLKCDLCSRLCASKGELMAHKRKHHSDSSCICQHCGKSFTIASKLKSHEIWHSSEKPYRCDLCARRFKSFKSVRDHMVIHTGEKPYICRFCGKRFPLGYNLHVHEMVHLGEEPYKCTLCPAKFGQKNQLIVHMRKHTGERPFKCSDCSSTFTSKESLIQHQNIHLAIKPHKCYQCFASFSHRSSLRDHKRTHTRERPFECATCGSKYRFRGNWLAHTRMHTGERPYSCSLCGKRFVCSSSLCHHRRSHYKTNMTPKKRSSPKVE